MSGQHAAEHDEIRTCCKGFDDIAHGMSSTTALDKHAGGKKEYRACEGKEVVVPYKGPVAETIQEITGGIRSACAYVGAARLKDLSKCTTFVLCHRTHNTIYES
jgi:GMP reductase